MDYGWTSLLPPFIAILIAIVTRRVIPALAAAVLVGGGLLAYYGRPEENFAAAVIDIVWWDHLYPQLASWDKQRVLIFSLTLGAMVGVIEAVGGMEALVQSLSRRVKTRRGAQLLVWFLGLGVFFDDYANTLLLGSTMRSTADRMKFSRAKLAYLVDSTAAPVAGLALISTWVAVEISYIQEGLSAAGVSPDVSAFSVFLNTIAYRYYAIFALVLVAIIAWTGRDFGPMLAAEREAAGNGQRASNEDAEQGSLAEIADISTRFRAHYPRGYWLTAVVPVLLCIVVVLVLLITTGQASMREAGGGANPTSSGLQYWGEVFGNSDSYGALLWGTGIGLAAALGLGIATGRTRWEAMLLGLVRGAWHLLPAMLILWFAWALSDMTRAQHEVSGEAKLNTGGFLAQQLESSGMPGWLLPTAVFVTSGLVAFATGTSWGTMALLTPLSIQLAVKAASEGLGEAGIVLETGGPLLVATVGAVLAGSILGDHCSPISDTTVLSSRASGCDHILHVRTQMPYALVGGIVAIVLGTIPSGFGVPAWVSLTLGTVVLVGIVRVVGTPVET
jgi:Na+/H+ antiporter NhaC